jgi:SAM-dependent methyltransferase
MKKIDSKILIDVDKSLRSRYSVKLKKFGYDPRTLGWDTKENQYTRFRVATNSISMENSQILDVGCGLADFYTYLKERKVNISTYSGIDINPEFIDACKKSHHDADNFMVRNILIDSPKRNSYDVVSMFGVLNFKFSEFDNEIFAREMIEQAFKISRKAVVVDMLSERYDLTYQKEDFVHYYNPVKMLDFALSLTPHVQLRHDYASIPQREFLLVLRKDSWK